MKKGIMAIMTCICMTISAMAQSSPIRMNIWEGTPSTTNGQGSQEEVPEIQVYLPSAEKANGQAVVVCPGGGYVMRAMEHEGTEWAPYFNERGIACVVLSYRMPYGHNDVPMSDLVQAMRVVRKNAKAWNIKPDEVGVMGSSAGGHLATTLSGHAPVDARPNFQILFYPVVTMDKSYTHEGSRENLIGKDAPKSLEDLYSNEKQVRVWTPKTILLLADDDKTVPVQNSVNYYQALKKAKIKSALYIYPTGGHGFGIRKNFKYHQSMMRDLSEWLESIAPNKRNKQ